VAKAYSRKGVALFTVSIFASNPPLTKLPAFLLQYHSWSLKHLHIALMLLMDDLPPEIWLDVVKFSLDADHRKSRVLDLMSICRRWEVRHT
jgi:hypothetical protein